MLVAQVETMPSTPSFDPSSKTRAPLPTMWPLKRSTGGASRSNASRRALRSSSGSRIKSSASRCSRSKAKYTNAAGASPCPPALSRCDARQTTSYCARFYRCGARRQIRTVSPPTGYPHYGQGAEDSAFDRFIRSASVTERATGVHSSFEIAWLATEIPPGPTS
jgi:hypothetical protein